MQNGEMTSVYKENKYSIFDEHAVLKFIFIQQERYHLLITYFCTLHQLINNIRYKCNQV